MTTEEFVNDYNNKNKTEFSSYDYVKLLMIEFAKHHVTEALQAASEEADVTIDSRTSVQEGSIMEIDKESILNAYPLENIK